MGRSQDPFWPIMAWSQGSGVRYVLWMLFYLDHPRLLHLESIQNSCPTWKYWKTTKRGSTFVPVLEVGTNTICLRPQVSNNWLWSVKLHICEGRSKSATHPVFMHWMTFIWSILLILSYLNLQLPLYRGRAPNMWLSHTPKWRLILCLKTRSPPRGGPSVHWLW